MSNSCMIPPSKSGTLETELLDCVRGSSFSRDFKITESSLLAPCLCPFSISLVTSTPQQAGSASFLRYLHLCLHLLYKPRPSVIFPLIISPSFFLLTCLKTFLYFLLLRKLPFSSDKGETPPRLFS